MRTLVHILRDGGFPNSLMLESFELHVGSLANKNVSERGPSALCHLIESCMPVSIAIESLTVRRGSLLEVQMEEGLAFQRLGRLPNFSLIQAIECPFVPDRGYSFLVPLASLWGVLNVTVSYPTVSTANLASFSSLTSLRSLVFQPPLVLPSDVGPLSALVSLTRLVLDKLKISLLPHVCCAISQLALRELSIALIEETVPGPMSSLSSLPPFALPDSLTSLTACVRLLPLGYSDRSLDFFHLTSSIERLELRIGKIGAGPPPYSTLLLGPSLAALTALRSLRIDMTGYSPRKLALPDSISQLTALTRFATKGLLGLLRLPGESGTWDPRHKRTTEDFDGESKDMDGFSMIIRSGMMSLVPRDC